MGRPKALTEKQQQQVIIRSMAGESNRSIARDLGVTEPIVRRIVSSQAKVIKSASNQIVAAEAEISRLPILSQNVARDYLADLRAISNNLARAALNGSASAAKLTEVAAKEIQKATASDEIDIEGMKIATALQKSANDAAMLGVQLIQANKDKNTDPPKPAKSLAEFYGD